MFFSTAITDSTSSSTPSTPAALGAPLVCIVAAIAVVVVVAALVVLVKRFRGAGAEVISKMQEDEESRVREEMRLGTVNCDSVNPCGIIDA